MSVGDRKYWRDWASEKITSGAVTAALAALTNGWALFGKGPIKWIAERFLEEIWDRTGDKAVRWFMRKGWLAVDKAQGQIKIRKINKAKDENNPDDYWDSIGSI